MACVKMLSLITFQTWTAPLKLNLFTFKGPNIVWLSARSCKHARIYRHLLPTRGIGSNAQAMFPKTALSPELIR